MVTYLRSMGGSPYQLGFCVRPVFFFFFFHGIHHTILFHPFWKQYVFFYIFFWTHCLPASKRSYTSKPQPEKIFIVFQPITGFPRAGWLNSTFGTSTTRQDRGALRSGGAAQEQIWVMSQAQSGWTDSPWNWHFRTWKWMVGILVAFWGPACLQGCFGSFQGVYLKSTFPSGINRCRRIHVEN